MTGPAVDNWSSNGRYIGTVADILLFAEIVTLWGTLNVYVEVDIDIDAEQAVLDRIPCNSVKEAVP